MDSANSARLARAEARFEISQLPIRYALAVDQRDVDAWVSLFVEDVQLGRHGAGRDALRDLIDAQLRWFYRSIHFIGGHRIELGPDVGDDGPETATGHVYCRAEHEVDDRWIVMAIRYDDTYRRVGEEWLFERRIEHHWYAADVNEHPQEVDFDSWRVGGPPALPGREASWSAFWPANVTGPTSKPAHGRTP
ncbi:MULTISPECIES: nuclear transport factor 2 family protein [unclassified Rhodococcus (in: high G+C Gram-positive bacteria)]|uniref:nuclear transport factor 2 family protein n=1 Tax=unclassified Rhodococcus (in: high G+C Gram-positive bacteria) TaxID=192944 RepID=UPI000926FF38|nr:nuclear transport factor 2 family protein [Rhodococcus sp. M8]OLL20300.1 polyketide cyclase [Rhodococcus sp. M8]QPG44154.1 nuclear transport factor 2 family protein [Rhodococcus sp. M8]